MQSQSRLAASIIRRQSNRILRPGTAFSSGAGTREADAVESDKEYFSHHKASPLSEIEVADTRKPITKATDGTGIKAGDVVGWLPEQLETAEETMMRAAKLWEWNKMRGDPDAPQSRVLRTLRGEHPPTTTTTLVDSL